MTDYDLYRALNTVMQDAIKQGEKAQETLEKKPLSGWTEEKHKKYWEREFENADKAVQYCRVRLFQLNPD